MLYGTRASASVLAMITALGWSMSAHAQTSSATATPPTAPVQTTTPLANGAEEAATSQEATEGGSASNGDIIVTAQRRSESLSRVGATVSVIGTAELTSQGIDNPADLTRFVPGFQASQSYTGNPVYTLRGVGFNSPNANSAPPVGIYMDEAAIPYPYMSLGLVYDLERVEVLKGPQGTLYGRNATGGLLNFVTAKPTRELHAGGTVELGNYQTVNASGFLSGPFGGDFRGRIAFNSQNRNQGWQRSVTRDDRLGRLHQNSLRAIIEYGNDGPLVMSLTANYWNKTGDTLAPQSIYYFPAPGGNPLARASVIANPTRNTQADWTPVENQSQADIGIIRPAPITDSEFVSGTFKASYEVSDGIQLASLTTYQHLRNRDVSDLAGLQVTTQVADSKGTIGSFSQELRLVGTSSDFNWSVGGYYANDTYSQRLIGYNDQNNTIATLRAISASLPQTRYTPAEIARSFGNFDNRADGKNEVLSAFANVDYRLNDQIKFTLGGRYTQDRANQDACTYDYRGGNVAVVNLFYGLLFRKTENLKPGDCYTLQGSSSDFVNGSVKSSQKQHNFAWRANVDFTPNATTLIYGTISRGYKSGGFPLVATSRSGQLAAIDQEQLTAYEIGAKLGLFDRRVQLNVSGFYYDYKNKQAFGRIADLIFGTLSRIDNIPKSHEYGVEADATVRLTPELRLNLAGVYLKSKITRYTGFNEFSKATDFAGKPYAYTPEFQGNALLSYDAPITPSLRGVATAAVSFQSKSNASFAQVPQFEINARALVGGTVGIADANDRWSASLYVENLFNKYYWNGVSSATDSIFRFPGMPRTGGVRISFKY